MAKLSYKGMIPLGGVNGGTTDNTTEPNIPYKLGDTFENSNLSQDPNGKIRALTEIIAEQGIDTTPATIQLGDGTKLESSGSQQINESGLTNKRYQIPYQEIDKTGTKKTFQVDVESEVINDIRQPIDTNIMTSPLVFTITAPRNEIVNKIYLKTNSDITNFRYQLKALSTGNIVDSFPDKFKYEKGEGVDLTGAGIQEIDLYYSGGATPNRFIGGEDYEVTMEWDSGDFLGDISNVPYYGYDYQEFEFVDMLTEKAKIKVETLLQGYSAAPSQQPTSKGSPKQIEFGSAQGTGLNPVNMDSTGKIYINETGEYTIRLILHYGRLGNPGEAILFARCLINGNQAGSSLCAVLDNYKTFVPMSFSHTLTVNAGDEITYDITRDNSGENYGGLFQQISSTVGVENSQSATIGIYRSIIE